MAAWQAGLNFLGATLLLIAAWMAGLSLAFGVSWLTVMDRLGALAWAALGWLRTRSLSAQGCRRGTRAARGSARRRSRPRRRSRRRARRRASSRRCPIVEKSARVERERQVPLFDPPKANELPPLKLLDDPPPREPLYSAEALEALSRLVEMKLKDFAIEAEVVAVQPGPVVTRFELRPAPGVKASQITALPRTWRARCRCCRCAWWR